MRTRKCNNKETSKIIKLADACFKEDRSPTFTFKNSKPAVYDNKNTDYSNIYYVIENEDNEMIALGET